MVACHLIATPRYSVFGNMAEKCVEKESIEAEAGWTDRDGFDIPRMRLRELNTTNSSRYSYYYCRDIDRAIALEL